MAPMLKAVAETGSGWRRILPLFLVILMLAVFSSLVQAEYLMFDEDQVILRNPLIMAPIGFSGLVDIFTSLATNQYSPLSVLSFWLEYNLVGFNSSFSHLINLLLHVCCAITIYALMTSFSSQIVAWLIAALWAVHPVQVETVAWVLERRNLLHAMFYFASLLVYLRYIKSGRRFDIGLALLFMLLSGLAKTLAFMVPAGWFLLDWVMNREISWHLIREKTAALLLAVALLLTTFVAADSGIQPGASSGLNLKAGAGGVAFYFAKAVIPAGLSATYELNSRNAGPDGYNLLLLLAAFVSMLIIASVNRFAAAGILLFLLQIAPMSGLVRVGYNFYAGLHFLYIPLLGLVVAVVAAIGHFARAGFSRRCLESSGLVVVLLLSILSYQYCQVWMNTGTLFEHSLLLDPANRFARNQLAIYYEERNQLVEAEAHFRELMKIYPDFFGGYYGIARIFALQNRSEEALDMFERAANLNIDRGDIPRDHGRLLMSLRRFRAAEDEFTRSLQYEPGRRSLMLRAEARRRQGDYTGAINDLDLLARSAPGNLAGQIELMRVLVEGGRWLPALEIVLRLLPQVAADPRSAADWAAGISEPVCLQLMPYRSLFAFYFSWHFP